MSEAHSFRATSSGSGLRVWKWKTGEPKKKIVLEALCY